MSYKKLLFLLVIFCCQILSAAYSQSLAIITSRNIPLTQDVIQEINSNLKQTFTDITIDTIYTEDGDFIQKLKNKQYQAVCALGTVAAQIAKALPDTPVIFSMAVENSKGDINSTRATNTNLTGVFLSPEPQAQIDIIKKVLPGIKTIYLFHDGVSRDTCDNIVSLQENILFTAQTIENANKVPAALASLNMKSGEAFWMLPDSTIYNKDSLAFILNYSVEKRIPIIGFAPNVVKAGAVLGYVFDYSDIGKQTAKMIEQVINGASPKDIPPQRARKIDYAINLKIAEYLGIKISSDAIQHASETVK